MTPPPGFAETADLAGFAVRFAESVRSGAPAAIAAGRSTQAQADAIITSWDAIARDWLFCRALAGEPDMRISTDAKLAAITSAHAKAAARLEKLKSSRSSTMAKNEMAEARLAALECLRWHQAQAFNHVACARTTLAARASRSPQINDAQPERKAA